MPEECASIRSMARWVLPVLVGPSTAVTPAPRARDVRLGCGENEMAITRPDWRRVFFKARQGVPVSQCDGARCLRLSLRTSLERIAPESLTQVLYGFVHGDIWRPATHDATRSSSREVIEVAVRPLQTLTRAKIASLKESSLRAYWVFAPLAEARVGPATETNWVGLQHGCADRRRQLGAEGHQHAGAFDRRQPHLDITLLGEVFNRRRATECSRQSAQNGPHKPPPCRRSPFRPSPFPCA